jgi:hypothetical protein
MTLTIEVPEELEEPLKAQAQTQGVSPAGYVQGLLEQALESPEHHAKSPLDEQPEHRSKIRSIRDIIAENMKDVPPEEFAKLPKDGADEHDHYLYGSPKRNG